MNRTRRLITVLAAVNIVVMLLVPPCDSLALGRGTLPTFDAYYPVFDTHPRRFINADLLSVQLAWVGANALFALLLAAPARAASGISPRIAVLGIAAINLALMLLFPPFENYSSSTRIVSSHFDGFYFAFGDRSQRALYMPLLYLELMVLAANTAVLWLALADRRSN